MTETEIRNNNYDSSLGNNQNTQIEFELNIIHEWNLT